MILGKNLIKMALRNGWIYCNPEPVNITECSIDVTLGDGGWIAKNDALYPTIPAKSQFEWVDFGQSYMLQPNTLLITYTNEFVGSNTAWLTPQIRSRSTIARWGFEVGTAALFGEPGFHSRWALELHNTTGKPIMLQPNWRVGQVIFQFTIGATLYKRQYNANEEKWTRETLLPKIMN